MKAITSGRMRPHLFVFLAVLLSANAYGQNLVPVIEKAYSLHIQNLNTPLPYAEKIAEERKLIEQVTPILFRSLMERTQISELSSRIANPETFFQDALKKRVEAAIRQGVFGAEFAPFRALLSQSTLDQIIGEWVGIPMVSLPLEKAESSGAKLTANSNSLHIASVEIGAEIGGEGAGNGLLEPGEWLSLDLTLVNGSKFPWFSTSLFLSPADSNCVWVESGEIEPGEFLESGSEQQVEIWMHLSKQCTAKSFIVLNAKIVDSHRSREQGLSSTIRIPVEPSFSARITNPRLDTDIPGESRGSNAQRIIPGIVGEVSAGVNLEGRRATAMTQSLSVASDQHSIFFDVPVMAAEMGITNGKLGSPGDDLELRTKLVSEYQLAQLLYKPSRKFMSSAGAGELWIAADILISATKGPKLSTPGTVPSRPTTAISPPPLTPRAVLKMVKKNIRFESREMAPKSGAIGAVTGHDVFLDEEAFEKDLAAFYGTTKAPVTQKVSKTATPGVAQYHVRRFFSLPIEYGAAPAPVKKKPAPRPRPRPAPIAQAPVEPPANPWNRIDLGVGFLSQPAEDDQVDDIVVQVFSLDYFLGEKLTFMAHLHSGSATSSLTPFNDIRVERDGYSLGVGYLLSFVDDLVEVHPHAGLGLEHILVTTNENTLEREEYAAALNTGVVFRFLPTDYIGIHAALDVFFTNVSDDLTGELYSGFNPTFSGGITVRF